MASNLTQKFIQRYYVELCEGIDIAVIAGKVFAKGIIDYSRHQEIRSRSKGSTQEANSVFADYLYTHANEQTLDSFLQILEKDQQYPKHQDLGAAMREDWIKFLPNSEVSRNYCM